MGIMEAIDKIMTEDMTHAENKCRKKVQEKLHFPTSFPALVDV